MSPAEDELNITVGTFPSDPMPFSRRGILGNVMSVCTRYQGHPAAGATLSMRCTACNNKGRWLIVYGEVSKSLIVCEVHVYVKTCKGRLRVISRNLKLGGYRKMLGECKHA